MHAVRRLETQWLEGITIRVTGFDFHNRNRLGQSGEYQHFVQHTRNMYLKKIWFNAFILHTALGKLEIPIFKDKCAF